MFLTLVSYYENILVISFKIFRTINNLWLLKLVVIAVSIVDVGIAVSAFVDHMGRISWLWYSVWDFDWVFWITHVWLGDFILWFFAFSSMMTSFTFHTSYVWRNRSATPHFWIIDNFGSDILIAREDAKFIPLKVR